jgi:Tfp pilus assembly protein PilX
MSDNTKLFCLFLKAQKKDKLSEQGYAMVVVSILSIIMFSLLAASLIFSNLAKSRTDAFVDGQSSFAVAESGLNKRAADLQERLETYSGLTTIASPGKKVDSCFGVEIPTGKKESPPSTTVRNDFECRNYSFDSSNNISKVAAQGGGISLNSNGTDNNTYVAYTFVEDKTQYVGESPDSKAIPTGEPLAGLNAAEYKYVVQSTGRKPTKSGSAESSAAASSSNTNLSMAFTTRVVPLFQFAIFYNGDLEFNSTSKMQVKGRVHSNANIYVQPAGVEGLEGDSVTEFRSIVTSAGKIYNRVDAFENGVRNGITQVLLTGNDCVTGTCQPFPYNHSNYGAITTAPLNPTEIGAFPDKKVQDGAAGAVELKVPSPGFTRKRNYADNKIGIYYARADMRLEMVPDRDVTARPATGAWTRDKKIIPFNFTSIVTGTANCTFTPPAAGSDPEADYIESSREKFSTRQCNKFTKGQLQSLRQPVLVLTGLKNPTLSQRERETLGGPTKLTEPAVVGRPTFPVPMDTPLDPFLTSLGDSTKDKILRALQVALVSTPEPVTFERLNQAFSLSVYGDSSDSDVLNTITCSAGCDSNLNSFKTEFKRLIKQLFPVNPTSPQPTDAAYLKIRTTLFSASPNQIAALRDAWFLPAPIQRVETNNNTDTSNNPRSSGFYDGREKRWITMLQTNIASLSVWNRDGLYVNADDEVMTSAYAASLAKRNLAFNNGTGANFTDRVAFDRPAADSTKPVGSLQYLGLGSSDKTEGGLVIHASVNDDLDGNGTMNSDDVTVDKSDTNNRILKKNPDNTDYKNPPNTGPVVVIDYYRKYPGKDIKQSPFAFAFNGGNYLPSALTLVSDRSIYVQGNFNNNANNDSVNMPNSTANTPSPDRLSASVIADTITVLSNECVGSGVNLYGVLNGVPASQLKCGLKTTRIADTDTINAPDGVSSPMAINAAFLSNTDVSIGNYPNGGNPLPAVTDRKYSGGVNNYIRLLENWGNAYALNYSGSLISLGTPLEYSGEYVSGGGETATRTKPAYYNIPIRNFNYDTKFDKNETVPPLTPKASYVLRSGFNRAY